MKEFTIHLKSVSDVECFVSIATAYDFRVLVSDGNCSVNGKSFMQMFCLDFCKPLSVSAECTEESFPHFYQEISSFLTH